MKPSLALLLLVVVPDARARFWNLSGAQSIPGSLTPLSYATMRIFGLCTKSWASGC